MADMMERQMYVEIFVVGWVLLFFVVFFFFYSKRPLSERVAPFLFYAGPMVGAYLMAGERFQYTNLLVGIL